jgi:hypothetical protein
MGWTRVAPIQVFTWGRLYAEGALSAIGAGEDVVPARRFYPPANAIAKSIPYWLRSRPNRFGFRSLTQLKCRLNPPSP